MTERSIADLIGWERKGEMDEVTFFVPPDPNDPRRVNALRLFGSRCTPAHTVDDLLDWLREQGWVQVRTETVPGACAVIAYKERAAEILVVPNPVDRGPYLTLLAALEQMVRAVAGQDGP
jgi:hypothetical protein